MHVDPATLCQWESGQREPRGPFVERVQNRVDVISAGRSRCGASSHVAALFLDRNLANLALRRPAQESGWSFRLVHRTPLRGLNGGIRPPVLSPGLTGLPRFRPLLRPRSVLLAAPLHERSVPPERREPSASVPFASFYPSPRAPGSAPLPYILGCRAPDRPVNRLRSSPRTTLRPCSFAKPGDTGGRPRADPRADPGPTPGRPTTPQPVVDTHRFWCTVKMCMRVTVYRPRQRKERCGEDKH